MKLPRPAIFVSIIAAVVLITGVLGALLLPRIVDSQMIRDRISAELAKRFGGSLILGKIELLWFPRPSVVIDNAELSFDTENRGSIRTAKIYPSILDLLAGRLVVHRALLRGAEIKFRLPKSSETSLDLEELEKQIGAALTRFASGLPARRIDLSDGFVEIRIADHAPVIFENLTVQTNSSPSGLQFALSARSNLCDGVKIEGKIAPVNLAAELDIGVERFKINDSLALLGPQGFQYLQHGEASFAVKIASVGLRKVKASIDGSGGLFVFARHGGTATVEAKSLQGGLTYEGGTVQVAVDRLDLGSPRLQASGDLKISADLSTARIDARGVDIAEVGNLALRLVSDTEGVKKILRYVPAGTIPEMTIQSAGRSFAELALTKNIVASGLLRDGKVFIPAADLELMNVGGSVQLADGILSAKDIAVNLDTAKGWNGTFMLGLERKASPFHLDIVFHSGAPELQSILLKLVRDEAAHAQLLKVRNVEGEMSGRLILGESIDAISPIIAISKANIRATSESVAFPVEIRNARLNYDPKVMRLEAAHVSIGRSTFDVLGVTLHHDGSRQIRIDSKRTSLDLQQADMVLRKFEALRSYFAKLQYVRGEIELQSLALSGSYDDPAGWRLATSGTFNQVEIKHADFPDTITVSRGKFDGQQERINFSDTAALMSDATLIVGGTFEYNKGTAIRFDLNGTGTFGGEMCQRLSRYIGLPEEIELRSPVKVAAERLAWRAGGEITFRGKAILAGESLLTLDVVKHPQRLVVQNLTIDDDARRARMVLQLAKDKLDLSFSGALTQQTIDKVFTSFPTKGISLGGDLEVSANLADPVKVSARGKLSGINLLVPFGAEKALVEKFSIEASGDNMLIRSVDLRWRDTRLSVAGKVGEEKGRWRLDLDISGDRLSLQDLDDLFAKRDAPQGESARGMLSLPEVEGMIRLKLDHLTAERFALMNLQIKTAISPSLLRGEIDRAFVCGINTSGSFEVVDTIVGLDLQLSATNMQLEPTTTCLTNQQSDVKGTYSLKVRINGRGDRAHLRSSLKGNFEFSARDGEFVRSAGIDATFDYLNGTGDFALKFPDLNKQAFRYRMWLSKDELTARIFSITKLLFKPRRSP